jgi:hypothetical protein
MPANGADDGPTSRLKGWLLLDANRLAVTVAVSAGLFVTLLVVGAIDPVPLRVAAGRKDPIETLFQALVTAIITGVTLVVTINQLVLSQELGAVGDQRERMDGAMAFRDEVEATLDVPVSPPSPAGFLRVLVEGARDGADAVDGAAADAGDPARSALSTYAADLRERADRVDRRLADAEFGTFAVLSAALAFDYSRWLHGARRLRAVYAADLPAAADDALADVVAVLELFGPAREHVKTLYFQWELIDLSRTVLYAAVPALAVTASMILYVDTPATVTGTFLGVDALVWVVAGAATVAVTPFVLLAAYVLRIATVAKRTLAIGPFALGTQADRGRDATTRAEE